MPLSAIALKIINNEENDEIRKLAELEIKKRFKYTSVKYDDFMQRENFVAQKRGYNVDSYLFREYPNMQQLMNLYFEHVCYYQTMDNYFSYSIDQPSNFDEYVRTTAHKKRFDDADLMLSEIHLCNGLNYQPFFEKIAALEIKNLEKQIPSKMIQAVKNELILRLNTEKRSLLTETDITDVFYNELCIDDKTGYEEDVFELISEYFLLKNNLDNLDNKVYQDLPLLKKVRLLIRELINCTAQDFEFTDNLKVNLIAISDAQKLKKQKTILLNQAKSGYKVDYSQINFPKQLVLRKEVKRVPDYTYQK